MKEDQLQAKLEALGLGAAYAVYNGPEGGYAENTIKDIVGKLALYGDITAKQAKFVSNLLAQIAERALPAAPVPAGRYTVRGEVLSTKAVDSFYGTQLKMLVKDETGFKVYGSIPGNLELVTGPVREYLPQSEVRYYEERGNGRMGQDADGRYYLEYETQRGLERGDKVEFYATLTPSDDDPKFGFFKRPAKARLLNA